MGVTKMGYEGEIYYGVAGSTATTKITNSRDITISVDAERGDTTVRGAGAAPPVGTGQVTGVNFSCDWSMLEKSTDSTLEALKGAATSGTPVALRLKDHSAGKGFDGDVTLNMKKGKPLKGEQTIDFTAEPTGESTREPSLYV